MEINADIVGLNIDFVKINIDMGISADIMEIHGNILCTNADIVG